MKTYELMMAIMLFLLYIYALVSCYVLNIAKWVSLVFLSIVFIITFNVLRPTFNLHRKSEENRNKQKYKASFARTLLFDNVITCLEFYRNQTSNRKCIQTHQTFIFGCTMLNNKNWLFVFLKCCNYVFWCFVATTYYFFYATGEIVEINCFSSCRE